MGFANGLGPHSFPQQADREPLREFIRRAVQADHPRNAIYASYPCGRPDELIVMPTGEAARLEVSWIKDGLSIPK